jgi:hypothetical protein
MVEERAGWCGCGRVGGRTRIVTESQPLFGTAHLTDAYTSEPDKSQLVMLHRVRRGACKGFVIRPQTCLGLVGKHAKLAWRDELRG